MRTHMTQRVTPRIDVSAPPPCLLLQTRALRARIPHAVRIATLMVVLAT